jgi:hypothetical protein
MHSFRGQPKLDWFFDLVKRAITYHYHTMVQLIAHWTPAIGRIRARVNRRMQTVLAASQTIQQDQDGVNLQNSKCSLNSILKNIE